MHKPQQRHTQAIWSDPPWHPHRLTAQQWKPKRWRTWNARKVGILPCKGTTGSISDSAKTSGVKEPIQHLARTLLVWMRSPDTEDKLKNGKGKLIKEIEMLKKNWTETLRMKESVSQTRNTAEPWSTDKTKQKSDCQEGGQGGDSVRLRHTQRKERIDQHFKNSEIHSTDQHQEPTGSDERNEIKLKE